MKITRPKTRLLTLALLLTIATSSFAGVTGDPSVDSGWTSLGTSLTNKVHDTGTGAYDVNMYTTAFILDASSPLTSGTINWSVGDTIVGVGGDYTGTNTDLTYDGTGGATSTRIVVKYGTSAATWTISGSSASLANGGQGSVLLGTNPYDFSSANAGTLILPSDAPTEQSGPSTQTALTDTVGAVITAWSGSAEIGFESFLDLTALNTAYPGNGVALSNKFILDLQRGTSSTAFQDSLGNLPAAVNAAPEPASLSTAALAAVGLLTRRRRRI